jgi:hypothetical protein
MKQPQSPGASCHIEHLEYLSIPFLVCSHEIAAQFNPPSASGYPKSPVLCGPALPNVAVGIQAQEAAHKVAARGSGPSFVGHEQRMGIDRSILHASEDGVRATRLRAG